MAELQAAYSDLTIVVDSQAACQTTYSTTVTTNVVCDECDDLFEGLFSSEAPVDFDLVPWQKAAKVYDENALMGIRFRANCVYFRNNHDTVFALERSCDIC